VIGVLASCAVAWVRHGVEAKYRTVEIVVDGEDWTLLARRQGMRSDDLWTSLRLAGATSVGVYEQTLKRLADAGLVTRLDGAALLDHARLGQLPPVLASVARRPDALRSVYVFPEEAEVARLVQRGFTTALGADRIRQVSTRPLVFEVRGWRRDLDEIPLGFLPSAIRAWEQRGLRVVLRPRNIRSMDRERLQQRVAGYAAFGRGRTFIFEGSEVLGYDHLILEAAGLLRQIGGVYGRVEVLTAARRFRGEDALAAAMAPHVVRVFSIGSDELFRITPAEAQDRFVRAARERNLRILYVRPFHAARGGQDPIAYNLHYLRSIAAGLRAAGFELGRATALPVIRIPRPFIFLAAGAAVAASTLVLTPLVAPSRPVAAGVIFGLAGTLALASLSSPWMRKLTSLAAAIAAPTLAVYVGLPRAPRSASFGRVLLESVGRLWAISLASSAGGLVVAALLTQWRFMMASDVFFGVKIATVLPLVLVPILWLLEEDRHPLVTLRRVWDLLDRPLSTRTAVLVVGAGAVGVVLLLRTGNTSLPVLGIEERLRNALEGALVARPRTKEYLVGHPAMLLGIAAILWGARRWALPLIVLGTVGQAGLVNSFSHLHTPILYTIWRTANGVGLGTLLGVAVLACAWVLARPLGRAASPPVPEPPRVQSGVT